MTKLGEIALVAEQLRLQGMCYANLIIHADQAVELGVEHGEELEFPGITVRCSVTTLYIPEQELPC